MTLDDHPLVLPKNCRIDLRFFLLPIEVAGIYRWCEHVRVVQRYVGLPICEWLDIGFYDELIKVKADFPEVG